MKKSTLLKIYKELNNMTECITNSLYKLIDVKGDAEYIFLDFCKKHKSVIDEENIEYLMQISSSFCSINTLEYRNNLIDSIDIMLENDIITSSEELSKILENIIYLLTIDVSQSFECEDRKDYDYYITKIICNFIKGLCKCSDYDMDKLYSHDMEYIIENFFVVLEDLNRTIQDDFNDSNFPLLKRIELYLDIVFDKNIYELNDTKYRIVLDIASTIEDNDKLSKLKSKVLMRRYLDDEEFLNSLDDDTDQLTETTVNRLYKVLNIKKQNNDGFNIIERENDNVEEELKVIDHILSLQNTSKNNVIHLKNRF